MSSFQHIKARNRINYSPDYLTSGRQTRHSMCLLGLFASYLEFRIFYIVVKYKNCTYLGVEAARLSHADIAEVSLVRPPVRKQWAL